MNCGRKNCTRSRLVVVVVFLHLNLTLKRMKPAPHLLQYSELIGDLALREEDFIFKARTL
jgi:hypothetical protein